DWSAAVAVASVALDVWREGPPEQRELDVDQDVLELGQLRGAALDHPGRDDLVGRADRGEVELVGQLGRAGGGLDELARRLGELVVHAAAALERLGPGGRDLDQER